MLRMVDLLFATSDILGLIYFLIYRSEPYLLENYDIINVCDAHLYNV